VQNLLHFNIISCFGTSFELIIAVVYYKMKKIFTLILVLSAAFGFAQTDSVSTSLPSAIVKNIEGEDVNLADYANNDKITVISFWATWCKPCIKELKNVNDLLEDWEEDYGVELVAISVDDSRNAARVKPMVNGLGWDFDVLLDPNGDIQRAMNVANPPVTFLLNQNGDIVYTHTGYVEGDELELEDHIKELAE
jgi:cytochrome c biogenesis protein CcmG/thiol:disulfide interchange protein DsbE